MKHIIRQILLNGNPYTIAATTLVQNHAVRVALDGGTFPYAQQQAAINYVASAMLAYGTTNLSSVMPLWVAPHYFGWKVGTGSGVTANGYAAATLYSLLGASSDFTQGTLANQPLLLPYSGTNYWWNGGVTGNYCSTPNAAANQITGNIEIIWYGSLTSVPPSSINCLVAKKRTSSTAATYGVEILNTSGNINLLYRDSGGSSRQYPSTASIGSVGVSANQYFGVKVTRNSSTGDVKFYIDKNDGSGFTQLGATVASLTGSMESSTGDLYINTYTDLTESISGATYRCTIANSIGGSPVVDFNPSSYSASTSQTQWTSATGEVWTINKSSAAASSGSYKGELVYRTMIQSDGVNDNLAIASFASTQPYTEYLVQERLVTGNLVAKATSNAVSNDATNYTLNNGSALTKANTSKLIQLVTTRNNGASSGIAINNGTETTGDAGSNNGTSITLIGGSYGLYSYAMSNANDNSTVRASIYSILSQMNGNAF